MKYNLLINKIKQIQIEYKDLLKLLLPTLKTAVSLSALDEINLFWFKNINLVNLYLANEFAGKDSYVFTASTLMDFDDKEHYPFLLLGKHHILDDPLCRYANTYSKIKNTDLGLNVSENLLSQTVITAEDNIKIIEKCGGNIIILPLRLLGQSPEDLDFLKMGEIAFVSLFKDIKSIKEYFEKCRSLADITKYIRKDIIKTILFSESDDNSLSFEQRYQHAKEENSHIFNYNSSEAYNFFVMIYGYIQQAVDIIVSCLEYECIPFIRSTMSLYYVLLLENSFMDIPFISEMRYKMYIANLIYRLCNKNALSQLSFNEFVSIVMSFRFNERVFDSLLKKNIDKNIFNTNTSVSVIKKCLIELYNILKS